ncbi:hypothetical protein SAY87_007983 [Trapa incisa]|uniref:F-box domain-containing protein n=1 Tax=Trapa incisa TaxID=236973 RepID=A0AAN7KLE6_9MYRT|nr:hypothetical protein SAY87_007983 [Trapa incisa]
MSIDDDYKMDEDYEVAASSMLTIHPDIIRDHIITRLDGPTLAVLSCVSSTHFNNLSYQHALWEDMCTSMWPSARDPIVGGIVSTFSSGYRWLFYNCYPRCY